MLPLMWGWCSMQRRMGPAFGVSRRVCCCETPSPCQPTKQRLACWHLVHAATSTQADVGALADLPITEVNPQLLRRLPDLWPAALRRLGFAQAQSSRALSRAGQLQADLDAAGSDRVRSHTELTTSLIMAQTQLAVVKADLEARIAAEIDLGRLRAALERDRAATNAAYASYVAVQSGAVWRVAVALREAAERHPRLARWARRALRVLWWTASGRLVSQLRFRRQVRAQLLAAEAARSGPPPSLEIVRPDPAMPPSPEVAHASEPEICLLPETGHREEPPPDASGRADWPLVSVVVTSFNYGHFVADAVDSVLAQTFKDLEVIVVEGGSSNPTSRLVVAALQRPRTRVLMQGGNHRAGANRNFGISQARGRYAPAA